MATTGEEPDARREISTAGPRLAMAGLGRRPITAAAPQRCVYGTLTPIIVLTSSPALSGAPDSLFPEADWSLWPLYPPVIVSASASFLLARSRHTDGPNRPTASPSEGRAG
ncbi:hypothetical protein [Streptomyces sp. NPDC058644]|uniref:hypothetical protein n=1 Tax=unclassified Streptomyces TaxID=2593676 RepID=UPI00365AFC42